MITIYSIPALLSFNVSSYLVEFKTRFSVNFDKKKKRKKFMVEKIVDLIKYTKLIVDFEFNKYLDFNFYPIGILQVFDNNFLGETISFLF